MERSPNQSEHSLGLLSWLAIAIFLNTAGVLAFFEVATSHGGNPIAAGVIASVLLVPVPIMLTVFIAVSAYRGWKYIQREEHQNEI